MKRRRYFTISIVLAGLLLLAVGGRLLWLRQVPDRAARLVAGRKLADAQQLLGTYLFWYGADSRARLLLAEAYALDDTSDSAVDDALSHLQRIPDTAAEAAEARFREGQLQFLLQHRPSAAERLLRESLRLRPDFLPANMLLWKLLDVTGRQPQAGELFWRIYDLSPAADRPYRLREAYLSEFSPGSASAELDRNWGVLGEDEMPNSASEFRRYEMFMKDEPQAALGYAAAILWCVQNHKIEQAAEFLATAEKLPGAAQEPLLSAATIALALDQGQFTSAAEALDRWPEPRAGYEFFKYQGTILDEVRQDIPAAVAAYRAAVDAETGDAEWTTQNRLAHCFRKLNDHASADKVQKQAKVVEHLMERQVHQRIRNGLVNLEDPRGLQPVLELYQALGRRRAIEAWQSVINALLSTRPAGK